MTKFIELLCFLLLIHVSSSSQDSSRNTLSAIHAELTSYGFPIGLLPTSIQNYTLNRTSGDFSLDFGDSCRITLPPDNYLATYSKKITGKIVHAHIADLDGIQVRALFKWWSITGIRSSNDNLVFEVGMVTAKYPSKNFNESLECEGRHSAS